jgi:phage terminase small subunit
MPTEANQGGTSMSARKPAELKRLEGNRGHRVIEPDLVEALGTPFVPEHLTDDARGCIEMIRQTMPSTIYSALDSFALAAFGTAWAVHKMAAHKIADPDFQCVVTGATGAQVSSPWLKVLNQQAALITSLGDRLGLNPAARAALKLPAKQQRSKFDGLIGRAGLGLPSN